MRPFKLMVGGTSANREQAPRRRRGRRSDAEANSPRVLDAADFLFAEQGSATTVEQVAVRAGVGRATVYRSFPTRASLVESMTNRRVEWMQDRLRASLAADDMSAEFAVFVHDVMLRVLQDRVLGELAAPPMAPAAGPNAEIARLMEQLVEQGIAAGCIAPHITYTDLGLPLSGLVLALIERGDTDPDHWHRAADLVLAATTTTNGDDR